MPIIDDRKELIKQFLLGATHGCAESGLIHGDILYVIEADAYAPIAIRFHTEKVMIVNKLILETHTHVMFRDEIQKQINRIHYWEIGITMNGSSTIEEHPLINVNQLKAELEYNQSLTKWAPGGLGNGRDAKVKALKKLSANGLHAVMCKLLKATRTVYNNFDKARFELDLYEDHNHSMIKLLNYAGAMKEMNERITPHMEVISGIYEAGEV